MKYSPHQRLARLSISTKLAVAASAITLLTALAIGWISLRAVEKARVESFYDRAAYIALGLAHDVTYPLMEGDVPFARAKASRVISRPLVRWAAVFNQEGKPVIDTRFSYEQFELPTQVLSQLLASPTCETVPLVAGSESLILASAPLAPSTGAKSAVVAISTIQLDDATSRARLWALIGSLASAALAGFLTGLVARLLSRPMAALAQGAQAIAEGNLTKRIPEPRSQDVATVVLSFNKMADRLAQAQAEVNRYAATLESLVEERTTELRAKTQELELSNKKMGEARLAALSILEDVTEANERLRELDRLKSEFLSNVSHELRTPLNAIIGFSELLVDGVGGVLSPSQDEFVSSVLTSARHLLQIINDILDLSKIQAGKILLEPESFEITDLVSQTTKMVKPSADKKGQSLETNVSPNLFVCADKLRIKQVLLNLLSNAVKFTDEGGWIRLEARQHGERVEISVSDNGMGIPPDKQEAIFEEFNQADGSATRRHEGTGLGLAISRRLVEMHGGRLSVKSSPGEGSVFSFSLQGELCAKSPAAAQWTLAGDDQKKLAQSSACGTFVTDGKETP